LKKYFPFCERWVDEATYHSRLQKAKVCPCSKDILNIFFPFLSVVLIELTAQFLRKQTDGLPKLSVKVFFLTKYFVSRVLRVYKGIHYADDNNDTFG
jgi:hypothetical protein